MVSFNVFDIRISSPVSDELLTCSVEQGFPTFLAPGTSFVEDSFSTVPGWGGGDGSGSSASDGERQMKLHLLAHHSPPAVWPCS